MELQTWHVVIRLRDNELIAMFLDAQDAWRFSQAKEELTGDQFILDKYLMQIKN